jgi:hypothetical protein
LLVILISCDVTLVLLVKNILKDLYYGNKVCAVETK